MHYLVEVSLGISTEFVRIVSRIIYQYTCVFVFDLVWLLEICDSLPFLLLLSG